MVSRFELKGNAHLQKAGEMSELHKEAEEQMSGTRE
jgi:hypothetical protein